jgi:hypothetical protein
VIEGKSGDVQNARQVVAMRGQGALSGRMDRRQRRATRDGRAALTEVAECASLFRPTLAVMKNLQCRLKGLSCFLHNLAIGC